MLKPGILNATVIYVHHTSTSLAGKFLRCTFRRLVLMEMPRSLAGIAREPLQCFSFELDLEGGYDVENMTRHMP